MISGEQWTRQIIWFCVISFMAYNATKHSVALGAALLGGLLSIAINLLEDMRDEGVRHKE